MKGLYILCFIIIIFLIVLILSKKENANCNSLLAYNGMFTRLLLDVNHYIFFYMILKSSETNETTISHLNNIENNFSEVSNLLSKYISRATEGNEIEKLLPNIVYSGKMQIDNGENLSLSDYYGSLLGEAFDKDFKSGVDGGKEISIEILKMWEQIHLLLKNNEIQGAYNELEKLEQKSMEFANYLSTKASCRDSKNDI